MHSTANRAWRVSAFYPTSVCNMSLREALLPGPDRRPVDRLSCSPHNVYPLARDGQLVKRLIECVHAQNSASGRQNTEAYRRWLKNASIKISTSHDQKRTVQLTTDDSPDEKRLHKSVSPSWSSLWDPITIPVIHHTIFAYHTHYDQIVLDPKRHPLDVPSPKAQADTREREKPHGYGDANDRRAFIIVDILLREL